jgi:mannosyltransferase
MGKVILPPWLLIVPITTVGILLRFININHQSLWLDEAASVSFAKVIAKAGLISLAHAENVAPMYYWLLSLLPNHNEFSIRLPAAIAGSLAIPAIYYVGRMLFSVHVGLVSAVVLAVSPWAIWHSQDGRMYSLLLLSTLLNLGLFIRAIGAPSVVYWWMLLGISTALGLYTHQYAALVSLALGCFLLLQRPFIGPEFLGFGLSQMIGIVLFAPWLYFGIDRVSAAAGMPKEAPLLWIPYTAYALLFGYSLGPSLRDLHDLSVRALSESSMALAPLALALLGLTIVGVSRIRSRLKSDQVILVVCCMVVPIVVAMLMPMVSNISYNVRYVTPAAPAFFILIAVFIVGSYRSRVGQLCIAALISGGLVSLMNFYTNSYYYKEDYRGLSEVLKGNARRDDLIILSSATTRGPLSFYGFDRGEIVGVFGVRKKGGDGLESVLGRIGTMGVGSRRNVWYVQAREWESDPERRIEAVLNSLGELCWSQRLVGIRISRYSVGENACPEERAEPNGATPCRGPTGPQC